MTNIVIMMLLLLVMPVVIAVAIAVTMVVKGATVLGLGDVRCRLSDVL